MLTFTKGKDTKFISEGSFLIPILEAQGWLKPEAEQSLNKADDKLIETKKKELKNGISGTASN